MTGHNDFDLAKLSFFMSGVSCFFRTFLLSIAALILTSNFDWLR